MQLIRHEKELTVIIEDNGVGFDTSKINDFDGKTTFSKTISLENAKNREGVKIYPNPANDVLIINNAEGKSVEIINILGQTIKSISPNNNQFSITINELKSGIYFIKIDNELIRFIKN